MTDLKRGGRETRDNKTKQFTEKVERFVKYSVLLHARPTEAKLYNISPKSKDEGKVI